MKQGDHEHISFEGFAKDKGLDTSMHPLHLLYLNIQTAEALDAFKAGYAARINKINPRKNFNPTICHPNGIDSRKVFFKVYQDKDSIGTYYVDTWENIEESMAHWKAEHADSDEFMFPVIEPVMMSQHEFDNLPEFQGF